MGGDQKGLQIFLIFKYINKLDVLIPNIVLKVVYGIYIRSYEHFKFQKLGNLRAISPRGKRLKFFFLTEKAFPPLRNLVIISSYEQILNLRIRKFKSYFTMGKWPVIDGKSEIIDGKGV